MTMIYIDNKPYEVKEGRNLLHACLDLGFDIPYFCWHPAIHSVGSCRLCAVKQFRDENDTRGRIVMSCMTPVAGDMRISIDDPEVRKFRAGIIELLMMNHPHDCPVCDEGGECHLQDMTLMTGHIYRAFRFRKRTFRNQNLGPFINHEMNRCIHCYRCVRFYRDYAGGRDLDVFASHHYVYFGRYEDGVLENVFSGNLVELCPTGVFTDKTLRRHFTRKWDMQTAPSLCVHCGLGCNTFPGERYGMVRRIWNRYNGEVNGYFLCDRGRFGYEFVNDSQRVRQSVIKAGTAGSSTEHGAGTTQNDVDRYLSRLIHYGAKVIGIGSPRASLEANYALRTLVGPEYFYSGMSEPESDLVNAIIEIMRSGPARSPSLRDVASSDAVLILGEDVINSAPILGLVLRQSVRNKPMEIVQKLGIYPWSDAAVRIALQDDKGPLFIASPDGTGLDDIAELTYQAAPDDIARFGFAIAHALHPDAPPVQDLGDDLLRTVSTIAGALKEAKHPLVISGTGCGSRHVMYAAANVAWALCVAGLPASLSFAVPECNSLGLGLMGAQSISGAFDIVGRGKVETVIVLENDLYRRAEESRVNGLFDSVRDVIVIDSLKNKTTEKAGAVLPAGTFAESGGTLVNNEGRAQRFFKVFAPEKPIRESWRWLRKMLSFAALPEGERWSALHEVTAALADEFDVFSSIPENEPGPAYRGTEQRIPRQPQRYSGRTAMVADITIHEPKPPDDPDSPYSFSMEGYHEELRASLLPRYWFPAWNSVQSLNKFQREVGGKLHGGDPGRRLIEALQTKDVAFFDTMPRTFSVRKDELFIVPIFHIFGSEELSNRASGIAELSPQLYLALNPDDAHRRGVKEDDAVTVSIHDITYQLSVRFRPALARGVAGMPVGLSGLDWIPLPSWGSISIREVTQ